MSRHLAGAVALPTVMFFALSLGRDVAAATPEAPVAQPSPATANKTTAKAIDELLRQEVSGGAAADAGKIIGDEAFARRAYLDLIGEWPSAAELTAFVFDPSPNKRAALVDRLLADERFGLNWGRYWRDVILYRRAEDRALLSSGAATQFFADMLNANVTWDAVATEIITATGNVAEEGAAVLYMAQMADPNEVASEVSRIFCGVQISCAQCHDHPTDRWKRNQFHELAAFFPRVQLRPVIVDGRQRGFEVVGRDFGPRAPFNNGGNNRFRPIEHYMPDLKDPSSQGTLMQPALFATGQKLRPDTDDYDRRHTLAKWITSRENPWFAKSLVNRIWAEMVGEGFYEPVDDIGPDRSCTAPQTLDHLATAFADQGYDMKWLYRTIAATEAYQRESRARRNPENPAETAFAANCASRIRGDQLFDALSNALGLPQQRETSAGDGYNPRALFGTPRSQFNQAFGYDPSAKRDEIAGSIPQALLLMNSPYLNAGINGRNQATTLGKLLADDRDDEDVAVELYLRCLAREPNAKELAVCLEHVKETDNRVEAFEDILWSIVNSTEFLHRQ